MAHEITVKNGRALFAQNKAFPLPWWEGTKEGDIRLQAALLDNPDLFSLFDAAGMNGETKLNALIASIGGKLQRVPDRFLVTYQAQGDELEIIGDVGNDYHLFTMEELRDTMRAIQAASGGELVNAGRLRDGRIAFVTLALKEIRIPGDKSPTRQYVNLSTGFDGSAKTIANASPVRVVCMNTLRASMRRNSAGFIIKHTKSHADKLKQGLEAIAQAGAYFDEWQGEMTRLSKERLTDTMVNAVLAELYDGTSKRAENIRESIASLYHGRQLGWADMPHGTSYTLIQAISQYGEHEASSRVENGRNPLSLLMERSLAGGSVDKLVWRAQEAIKKVVAA